MQNKANILKKHSTVQNQLHLQNTIFIFNHLYTFPPLDRNWFWSMSSNFAKPKSVIFTWFGFCTATQNSNNKDISYMSQILAHKALSPLFLYSLSLPLSLICCHYFDIISIKIVIIIIIYSSSCSSSSIILKTMTSLWKEHLT